MRTPFLPAEIRVEIANHCLNSYWKWEEERTWMLSALSLTDKLFREIALRKRFEKVWLHMDHGPLMRDAKVLSRADIASQVKLLELRVQYEYPACERSSLGKGPKWEWSDSDKPCYDAGRAQSLDDEEHRIARMSESFGQILRGCRSLENLRVLLGDAYDEYFAEDVVIVLAQLLSEHDCPKLNTLKLGTPELEMTSVLWSPALHNLDTAIYKANMRRIRKFKMIDSVSSSEGRWAHGSDTLDHFSRWLGGLPLEEIELCGIDPSRDEGFMPVLPLGNLRGMVKLKLRVVLIEDSLSSALAGMKGLNYLHIAECDIHRENDRWASVFQECVKLPLRGLHLGQNGYTLRKTLHKATICSAYPDDEAAFDELVTFLKVSGVTIQEVTQAEWKFCRKHRARGEIEGLP